jgi:transcriptional regulator of met regulon
MAGLFVLSITVLVQLAQEWLDVKNIVNLDSAFCNTVDRLIFLDNLLCHDCFRICFTEQEVHDRIDWITERFSDLPSDKKIVLKEIGRVDNFQNSLVVYFDGPKLILSSLQEHLPVSDSYKMPFQGHINFNVNDGSPPMAQKNNFDKITVDVHLYLFTLHHNAKIMPSFSKLMDVTVTDNHFKFQVRIRADASLDLLASLCFLDFDRHGRVEQVIC